MDTKELIETIIECAKRVRGQLTSGFEEKVYKNAMFIELRDCGIEVETEVPFNVYYKEHVVGSYKADIIANRKVIIELKATNALVPINEVQLVNYLTATGIDDGILINFGSEKNRNQTQDSPLQKKTVTSFLRLVSCLTKTI